MRVPEAALCCRGGLFLYVYNDLPFAEVDRCAVSGTALEFAGVGRKTGDFFCKGAPAAGCSVLPTLRANLDLLHRLVRIRLRCMHMPRERAEGAATLEV